MSRFTGSPAAVLRFMEAYGHEPPALVEARYRWIEAFARQPTFTDYDEDWFKARDDMRERMSAARETGFVGMLHNAAKAIR